MTKLAPSVATPDYEAIVHVVQSYVDGFNDHDVVKLAQAFHEDAWIFFTDAEGTLFRALIRDCFDDWAKYVGGKIVGRVISVIQAGDVAVVVLGFDSADGKSSSWVDIHSLLRLDGVWKIVNKSATHNSRAAWAGTGYSPRG